MKKNGDRKPLRLSRHSIRALDLRIDGRAVVGGSGQFENFCIPSELGCRAAEARKERIP
jgi:hypothetical protein